MNAELDAHDTFTSSDQQPGLSAYNPQQCVPEDVVLCNVAPELWLGFAIPPLPTRCQ